MENTENTKATQQTQEVSNIHSHMVFPFVKRGKGKHERLVSFDYSGRIILATNKVPENWDNFPHSYPILFVVKKTPTYTLVKLDLEKDIPAQMFFPKMSYRDFCYYLKKKNYSLAKLGFRTERDGEIFDEFMVFFYNPDTNVFGRIITTSDTPAGKKRCLQINVAVPYINFNHDSFAKMSTHGVVYNLKEAKDYFAFDRIEKRRQEQSEYLIDYWMCGYLKNPLVDKDIDDIELYNRQVKRYNQLPDYMKKLFVVPN